MRLLPSFLAGIISLSLVGCVVPADDVYIYDGPGHNPPAKHYHPPAKPTPHKPAPKHPPAIKPKPAAPAVIPAHRPPHPAAKPAPHKPSVQKPDKPGPHKPTAVKPEKKPHAPLKPAQKPAPTTRPGADKKHDFQSHMPR